ncbi:flagellar basal body-associated FliL family protein [bacterium]|nr:flagellar basal body-associated FliL family protein [bacterium]
MAVLVLIILVVAVSYMAAKKASTGPEPAPAPPPSTETPTHAPKLGRFNLGEFTATLRDEELHYIRVEVEIGFMGNMDKDLEERKNELRDATIKILMKLTVQRAKEDYVDGFLHKEIEKRLNEIMEASTSDSRIIKIFIPQFLIN